MTVLSTIGYEASSLEDFIATLQKAKVHTLIDVRELPISRRQGFAKKALSSALDNAGLNYVHLKGLGDPKEGRLAARANDMPAFIKIFTRHLESPMARADIATAVDLIGPGGACLMCYERDPNFCHRKLVAEKISAIITIQIKHLGVRNGIASGSRTAERTSGSTREGSSTRRHEAR
ncbi:DUF488 family protein [Hypericibacter sp.]|uniref:DUF488 domain-containing protein n=1 Tax=Hypericibacter sp. TaxID=2705401 RepID=UPI003D6CC542